MKKKLRITKLPHYEYAMTLEEIATELGITRQAVWNILHRGLTKVKKNMIDKTDLTERDIAEYLMNKKEKFEIR